MNNTCMTVDSLIILSFYPLTFIVFVNDFYLTVSWHISYIVRQSDTDNNIFHDLLGLTAYQMSSYS